MNSELTCKTPKRKSILWNYDQENHARIINIRAEAERCLSEWLKGIRDIRPHFNEEDGGIIVLNETGTFIWELCDGVTTLGEITERLANEFGASIDLVEEDVQDFMSQCQGLNAIDIEWRCME